MSADPEIEQPSDGPRMNGILLMLLLVLGGMGIGSFYYRWKAPPLIKELRAMRDALPKEGEPLLESWMRFGAPMIHNRLSYLRLSNQQPWLVSHVVESGVEGQPGEVWGIDCRSLAPGITRREGMQVRIELPAASMLARTRLVGDNAARVPRYAEGASIPDPNRRIEQLVEQALRVPDDFIAALESEIKGASIVIRAGQRAGDE